ncbi:hypothetical protein TIFTF001_042635 [Ficus carica]|uniref:Uncharacterized protein n=1 Tax=Ficus carica TaxID=3494 RepID=A0AA87ZI23_FICCA|nr:hypothetical protein TIFTF001_042635 [Ficus carica]
MGATIVGFNSGGIGDDGAVMVDYDDRGLRQCESVAGCYVEAWLGLEESGGLGKAGERGQAVGRRAYRKFAVATMGATIVGFNGGGIGDDRAAMVDYDGGGLRQW